MADTPAVVTEPTADEVLAAQAILNRKMVAEAAKVEAAKAPLRDLTDDPTFAALLTKASDLRVKLVGVSPFFEHLNAMVVGMEGLARDAA